MKLLIKHAHVIDRDTDRQLSVAVEGNRIVQVFEDREINEAVYDRVIDAKGLSLMPGFVDTHAHFRDPGLTYKEDLMTGSMAAANGGYTFVNLMANTKPVCDNAEVYEDVMSRAREIGIVGVNQTVAVTKDLLGQELVDLSTLPEEVGVLSDDGKDLLSNHMMYQACLRAKEAGKLIMVHAEDAEISPYDYRAAEDLITFRDVYLSGATGCRIHMSHVSTRASVEAVRQGKAAGYPVTCEVTPHHISLYDSDYRVNPPIRAKEDVEAMIAGIVDGTVDSIGTDHAPHSDEDKAKGSPGMVGIETAFAVCNTYLVRAGHIDRKRLSEVMSYGGARVLGLEGRGLVREGWFADLVLVDFDREVVVDPQTFRSKSHNTPYAGMKLYGEVVMTIRNGRIVKE